MDVYEATRIVYSRIQTLDPDHAAKIMGLLLLQDDGEKQMIRLAFGPETLLHSVVASARADLGLLSPCLFFSRGFCKNGNACRFPHSDADSDPDPFLAGQRSFGSSFAPNSGFLLHHDSQREAMAAAMMLGGEDGGYFGRSRLERYENYGGLVNPVSRQIYLTFPADSTFREEDVSNYFSIYGPVQDVRIPYQQKRMFGFVTFHYPETVKLILAKGNPHFVCDARVLVKPYKEKGKVVDKKMQQQQQQQQHLNGGDRLNDFSRDHYDLQQLGARMFYANNQEALLRRKLEEQQQAAELQQAIELQERRLMGLQLLDLKSRSFSSLSSPSPIHTPTSIIPTTRDEAPLPNSFEGKCQSAVNYGDISGVGGVESDKRDKEQPAVAVGEGNHNFESDFQESVEHNLPHSPFASPTKSSFVGNSFSMVSDAVELAPANDGNHMRAPSLLPTTPSLDMASIKSCLFQMPRFSSPGHGAIGM